MDSIVKTQIHKVHDYGIGEMLDLGAVYIVATENDWLELADYLEDDNNREEYCDYVKRLGLCDEEKNMQDSVPIITLYLVTKTDDVGVGVANAEWYKDHGIQLFDPKILERDPGLYSDLMPYLSHSFVSKKVIKPREMQLREVKIAYFYQLDRRRGDRLLFCFLKYLLGDAVRDGAYIKLTGTQALALRDIAGLFVIPSEDDPQTSSLFVHIDCSVGD